MPPAPVGTRWAQTRTERLARVLVGLAAVIALSGSLLHASFFPRAARVIGGSGLPPFYAAVYKGLWFGDSGMLLGAGLVLAWLAVRPAHATRTTLVAVAVVVGLTGAGALAFTVNLGTAFVFAVVCLSLAAATRLPPGGSAS